MTPHSCTICGASHRALVTSHGWPDGGQRWVCVGRSPMDKVGSANAPCREVAAMRIAEWQGRNLDA